MPTVPVTTLETSILSELQANIGEFPEPQILAVINQGLFRLNLITGFHQATVPLSAFSVADKLVYSVPSGILIPTRVSYEGRDLAKDSLRGISRTFRDWAIDSDVPQRWAPVGLGKFIIHPRDSEGGGLLEVSGVAPITRVTTGGTVTLEDQFIDLLVQYARFRLLLKEGGKAFADASMAYTKMVSQLKHMTIWQSMSWPRYWLLKSQETERKGA
jgi:hypothetical protein